LAGAKHLPLKSTNYYSKIIDKAKCQQNSPRGQYLGEEDDRVHNDLLEEIFNVQDSINLDYFELERQAIDPYPVEFSSGLTRLSAEFEQNDQVIHFGALDAEEEGYKLHELQSRQIGSDHMGGPIYQGSRKTVGCDKPGPEIIAVASPTISSTCETMTGNCGTVKSQPDSTSSSAGVDYTVSYVDSTTNFTQSIQPGPGSEDLSTAVVKTSCEMQLVGNAFESRPNIRPRAERSTRSGVIVESNAGVASGEVANPTGRSQVIASASGESTAASSTSTSPSQIHATKKQRTIECGSDLLADVRDTYDFVRGANLFAPSFHPTFSSFSVDTKTAVFQGHQQQVSQNDKDPTMSNVNDRSATPSRKLANTAWDTRMMASPGHIHMSCPDLASPLPQSPSLQSSAEGPSINDVAFSGYHGQRPGALQGFYQQPAYNESMTSLSAPCTPSKRSVQHFQPREQYSRSPAMPFSSQHMANISGNRSAGQGVGQLSMKPPQISFGNVPDGINRRLDLQAGGVNSAQRMPGMCQAPQFRNNARQFAQQNVINQNSLAQDLVPEQHSSSSYAYGTQASEYMQPQQPAGSLQRSITGAPLSQNAFLRGLINDKSSAFRSHRLFPLLRDIIIADMNFHTPSFPFQLICNLPSDFNHLIQNYISRNPHLANTTGGDATIESVFMDALAYAHATLIGLYLFFSFM
jgi:hypothetical protein